MPRIIETPVFFRGIATTHVATKRCKTRLIQAGLPTLRRMCKKNPEGHLYVERHRNLHGVPAESRDCPDFLRALDSEMDQYQSENPRFTSLKGVDFLHS